MIAVAVGVDIGGTGTKLGLISREGKIIAKSKFDTRQYSSETDYLVALRANVETLLAQPATPVEMVGIGIGAPKANYFTGRVEGAVNLLWSESVDIQEYLFQYFGVSVLITNDANLAAVGEKTYGSAKNMKNFLVVTIGTGLGCGIYIDGKLFHGISDVAGELGHTCVKSGGRRCQCGRYGCLEAYVSGKGIVRTAMELLSKFEHQSVLRSLPSSELTATMISEAAIKGDPVGKLVMDYTGDMLGYKLAEAIALFNPEAIFLSGGVANTGDLLLTPTIKSINQYLYPTYPDAVNVNLSLLKDDEMAVLGGGAIVWEHMERNMTIIN